MNEDLKRLFFKRFDAMMDLLSNADSTSARENRLLKTAKFDDSNEIEYKQSIQDLKIRGKYYEHQIEMMSDFDVLTFVLIPEEEQKKWFELCDVYRKQIENNKETFSKIANILEDDSITDVDSFIEFVMKHSSGVNTYYDMIKSDRDFKKSLFYCYIFKYIELLRDGVVKPYKFSEVLEKISEASKSTKTQSEHEEKMDKDMKKDKVHIEIEELQKKVPELRRDKLLEKQYRNYNTRVRGGLEEKPQIDFIGLILQSFKMAHFNM